MSHYVRFVFETSLFYVVWDVKRLLFVRPYFLAYFYEIGREKHVFPVNSTKSFQLKVNEKSIYLVGFEVLEYQLNSVNQKLIF